MTIGDKIRLLRLHNKWTQKYLAQQLGVTELSVRNIESGKCKVKKCHLEKISKLFGIDMSSLVDIPIQTYHQVMHNLFFLRENFGLRVSSIEDVPPSKRNNVLYFDSEIVSNYIEAWKNVQNDTLDYDGVHPELLLAWELLFPKSFAEDCSVKLDMHRKRGVVTSDEDN